MKTKTGFIIAVAGIVMIAGAMFAGHTNGPKIEQITLCNNGDCKLVNVPVETSYGSEYVMNPDGTHELNKDGSFKTVMTTHEYAMVSYSVPKGSTVIPGKIGFSGEPGMHVIATVSIPNFPDGYTSAEQINEMASAPILKIAR